MTFPIDLDDFTPKVDGVDTVYAVDVNELQSAIEAIEAKLGIDGSSDVDSIDYILSQTEFKADTAYGWGDHATEGYLKTETDPVFNAWLLATPPAYPSDIPTALSELSDDSTHRLVTDTDIGNWNALVSFPGFSDLLTDYGFVDDSDDWDTAYGWGNHSVAGYLTGVLATTTYLKLDGSNANSNIDIGTYNLTTIGITTTNSLRALTIKPLTTSTNLYFDLVNNSYSFVFRKTDGTPVAQINYQGKGTFNGAILNGDTQINGPSTWFYNNTTNGVVNIRSNGTGALNLNSNNAGNISLCLGGGNVVMGDGVDLVLNTTTGTKIGTETNQKLGFFNATPVIQQAYTAVSNPPTQTEVTAIRDILITFGFMAVS